MADFLLDDEIENQPEKTTAEFAKNLVFACEPLRIAATEGYFRLPFDENGCAALGPSDGAR
jgi:hypothetical protein